MTNYFAQLQSNPLLLSLFAAAVKSSFVLLAAWSVNVLLRRRSAALRHMIWVTASACALAVFAFSAALPQWKVLPVTVTANTAAKATPTSDSGSYKAIITPAATPGLSATAVRHSAQTPQPHPATSSHTIAQIDDDFPASFKVSLQPATGSKTVSPIRSDRFSSWQVWLTAPWIVGIFLCAGFYGASEWKLRRLTRRSLAVDDNEWTSAYLVAAGALGIRRRTELLSSGEIEVPLTFGILRPKILLPADYSEWTAQRRHAVLRHEMAHIARWDALTQIISQGACAIYWFNPLVWFAAKSARFERELACDDLVLAAGAAPSEYAGELLTMVSKLSTREEYAVALAMARRSQFEGRLLALLNPQQRRDGASRRTASLIAAVGIVIALPLTAMAPQDARPASAGAPSDKAANVITYSPDAPAAGVSGGANGGVDGGVQNGISGAVVTRPADDTPMMAPAAAEAPRTQTPDGWAAVAPAVAPHAEEGSRSGESPRPALAASTPEAPRANTRTQRPAVMPPPARQTGLECISTGTKHNSSLSTNDDGNNKSMVVNWSADDCSVTLNSHGDLKFSDDFSSIQGLSSDGFLEINARIHGDTRRLSVHPTSNNGPLEFVWWVNGDKQAFDDSARKWVTNFLVELDRHTAWAVKQRFPALMKEGGPNRVLDEVSYMSSDYARSVYLMTLVQQANLQPKELISTIDAASGMASDYETARVLLAIAGKYPLNDDASRQAFLAALDVLNSDYEHARVLMAFFEKGPIPTAMAKSVLDSASKLRSDYEHSRILVEMAGRGLLTADTQAAFLTSVNTIHSDYEHSRSLIAFLESRKSDDAAVLGVIKSAAQIQSDYEAARVLTTAASGRTLTGTMRDEYLKSAQHIRSQYERNRTLEAVGYHATSL